MTNLIRTHEDIDKMISDWLNERQAGWTDEEFWKIRSYKKNLTFFIRYSNMSPTDKYYAFEQIRTGVYGG